MLGAVDRGRVEIRSTVSPSGCKFLLSVMRVYIDSIVLDSKFVHILFALSRWLSGSKACLQRHSFQEKACQQQIDDLYACCNAFYARQGDDAKSESCPKSNLLRLKIKQREESRISCIS